MNRLSAEINAALSDTPPQLLEFVQKNIRPAVATLLDEWKTMTAAIRRDGIYQPLSAEERVGVMKALMADSYGQCQC